VGVRAVGVSVDFKVRLSGGVGACVCGCGRGVRV